MLENAIPVIVSARMRPNSRLASNGVYDQRLLVGIDALVFGLFGRLPEKQVGRDRRAEYRDQRGEKSRVPGDAWYQHAPQGLAPRHFHDREYGDIGEQAERQPLQHVHIALVAHEDLHHDRAEPEHDHVEKAGAANQELGGVPHGGEVGGDIDRVGDEQKHDDDRRNPSRILPA
jgi:hypothetical protein